MFEVMPTYQRPGHFTKAPGYITDINVKAERPAPGQVHRRGIAKASFRYKAEDWETAKLHLSYRKQDPEHHHLFGIDHAAGWSPVLAFFK